MEGDKELLHALQEYSKAFEVDAKEAVKELARTGARQLAMATEPYGISSKAKRIGEMAVSKDVSKAYSSNARTYNELRRINPRKANAYGAAMKNNDLAAAEKIVRSTLDGFTEVANTDTGSHLEGLRNSKGRVDSPNVVNLATEGAVSEIRREKMKTTGTAKAGWVQCGESIQSKSRFPAWLRKSGTLGTSSTSGSGWKTVVTLSNRVRYVTNVLSANKLQRALQATERNHLKKINLMVEKRAKML